MRGMVVSIRTDPLKPGITGEILKEFEAGNHGPLIA